MQPENPPENLDDILVALADPTRRAILTRLSGGPARVTDVAAPFDISLNSVSKHVRILERADLVVRFRSGREHILTFNPAPLNAVISWMESNRTFWTGRLKAFDEALSGKPENPESGSKRKKSVK